jgi:two-component sensor histidine kinase
MLDDTTALAEFRHRVANDLSLVMAVLSRRKHQMHVLSTGEILDEAIDAVASLSLLYRQLHDRRCEADIVDLGRHLASVGARMDAGYLSGLGIALHIKAPAAFVPSATAHALALIVLELVTNAARHSEASRIGVELAADGDRWSCSVADDGLGLPDAFTAPTRGGLHYVGRLAASLDGDLTITSRPKVGTRMKVCFPAPVPGSYDQPTS